MSQQDFADRLNVKRSNVAAYETKNVEPRFALLLEIAKLLAVNVGELLSTDLTLVPLGQPSLPERFSSLRVQFQKLAERNSEIASMVNGFQLFFEFKQQELQKNNNGTNGVNGTNGFHSSNNGDIDNFLIFLSHVRAYNESVTQATDAVIKRNEVPALSH